MSIIRPARIRGRGREGEGAGGETMRMTRLTGGIVSMISVRARVGVPLSSAKTTSFILNYGFCNCISLRGYILTLFAFSALE